MGYVVTKFHNNGIVIMSLSDIEETNTDGFFDFYCDKVEYSIEDKKFKHLFDYLDRNLASKPSDNIIIVNWLIRGVHVDITKYI